MNIFGRSILSQTAGKKILYGIFAAGLAVMFASYIPFLLDYYIMRPQEPFWEFYHTNILDSVYTFEGVLIGGALAVFYCLTLNCGVSISVVSLALFVLAHASYLKYLNRRELLRLDDLRLTEAAGMAARYIRFEYSGFLVTLLGGMAFFAAAGFLAELLRRSGGPKEPETTAMAEEKTAAQAAEKTAAQAAMEAEKTAARHGRRKLRLRRLALRLIAACVLCGSLAGYTRWFFLSQMQLDRVEEAEPVRARSDQYVLYSFLRNDSMTAISVENVAESYAYLLSQGEARPVEEGADYPNVIVIMNESWWNTDNLDPERIAFSEDPMGPFKELGDRCSTGYLTTNVYGGGTVSPEAEFLTGLNTRYYVGSIGVYQRTLDRKLPSLADYFNALDYETVAIHPYYDHWYSRGQVWRSMGFDKVIFEEDMEHRETYTRYISDEALAEQIIEEYESAEGKRFIWSVSIANHGLHLDYPKEYDEAYDYPVSVTLREELQSEEDRRNLLNYVNGIYLANKAYAKLVEYFEKTEEPVILVMYGDHIPDFSEGVLESLGLDSREESAEGAEDMQRKLYSVPVILWSNCSEQEITFSGESIYYLPQMLIDYAGLPDSNMTKILRYERSLFKTNSDLFVLDGEGKPVVQCTEEQVRGLRNMKAVEYNIFFGENICGDIWYPIRE